MVYFYNVRVSGLKQLTVIHQQRHRDVMGHRADRSSASQVQINTTICDLDGPRFSRLGGRAAAHGSIAQIKHGLVEGTFHIVSFDKAIAQFSVAMTA
jgi:hypothetical protein